MTAQPTKALTQASHRDMANAIRFLSADAVEKAKSGHPGMPMGMADVATVLFTRFLKFDAAQPRWADRDRFVLSAGHGSMLLYSLLYLTGYPDVDIEQIKNFRQLGARTAGHPEYGHISGAETTTGPLGQGIANAVGFALAEKMLQARFGKDVVDHYTYVIAGDGCLMEGISQEAVSMAGHWRLGKLIVLWDDNHICIDGDTSLSVSDDQLKRFEASNWDVCRVDGHDPEAVAAAVAHARTTDRPSLIACRTVIGFGSPTKAGSEKTHGAPLGAEDLAGMREGLGWPYPAFEIPDNVLAAWRAAGGRGAAERTAWEARYAATPSVVRAEYDRTTQGRLPAGWEKAVNDFKKKCSADKPSWATRKASQEALEVLTPVIPEMIGGSADLTHSNLTHTKVTKSITPTDFAGRYIHYGVREHGMAAVMNGMALHGGFIPYGGTFLVFADYLRPGLRMSALMGLRVIYVLTHDSIGLGEDGPTHQPIETVASLRAMPNVLTFRPCDAVETAECWALAVANEGGPSALALSRQNLPTLRTEHTDDNLSARGAYVMAEADGKRQVTILATGSEVSLAMAARDKLKAKGVAAAVVSMPCWELFDRQPADYRAKVLGEGTVRVAVEALGTFGWERYVGLDGAVIGMTGFGASAPAEKLYEHFGITADAVVDAAVARLK
ncbi:MAG: transketolase [Rhodospirillales bacterium]|nr:transketolase [Rhodospirillales bacterium]